MASNAAKAAHRGDGGDLRKVQSGRADVSEHIDAIERTQERLIDTCCKNGRSRFEISLKNFDGLRRVVLGVRDVDGCGGFKATGPTLVIAPERLSNIRELIDAAEVACREEGLLS